MASKPRTLSPFRFRKPSSVNGKLPGLASSSSSTSTPSQATGSSFPGRSLTPGKGRGLLPSSSAQKHYHNSNSSVGSGSPKTPTAERADFHHKSKENVSVTVRFRPLSAREIQRGDEVSWYADGDTTVRSEYNPLTAYGFDRVFGPATTTRHVYDVAAQQVVSGSMEGINGTVFAYGVTSSGKTHTMHGDQKSPGVIPLAIKDVFSIIQETPDREFLLRVSYLEIYNEVINDLLDPAGQNLRVREDVQGTYVEGVKEEVVLSPAHALSLIATGEEHRHVGSNNFNLLSSRSHTIFTLTIESSPRGDNYSDEEVTLSQLNLIDLAGSESSKTETTGLRRKEGSYINKSLLSLGTVIAKLTDGKATHIPYRDSKLTRLLQSSLSGHGRVSLICTVTPASSSAEETHNTLKFAHRAKHVEIHASQNRILDEKSLIKKYQKEIQTLKQELEQLKRGMIDNSFMISSQEDLEILKQQLEAGQVKLQSRLEEEEQAKAALMGRIQRLTKLILVSTKATVPRNIPERSGYRRRHSFGEDELAYLPDRRREFIFNDEDFHDSELSAEGKSDSSIAEEILKEDKKTKKRSMLGWFKLKRTEQANLATSLDTHNSPIESPLTPSSVLHVEPALDSKGHRKSVSRRVDDVSPIIDSIHGRTQAGELFSATVRGRKPPPTGTTMADQMDLLREQVKMLAGEVAFCTSSLKRLSEQAANNPDDTQLHAQMQKTKDEIQEKKRQMRLLEQRIVGTGDAASNNTTVEWSQAISKVMTQLNEKSFELEIKTADNRILQEQLQTKESENSELQEANLQLRRQLTIALENLNQHKIQSSCIGNHNRIASFVQNTEEMGGLLNFQSLSGDLCYPEGAETSKPIAADCTSQKHSRDLNKEFELQSQILQQVAEIDELRQDRDRLIEEKDALEIHSQKLAEESSYAKELASAAAVELKILAEEVTKLSCQNTKLVNELTAAKELAYFPPIAKSISNGGYAPINENTRRERRLNGCNIWKTEDGIPEDFKIELLAGREREAALEAALAERELREEELQKRIEDAKQRETDLENDLAGMWVLVAKLKMERENAEETLSMETQNFLENECKGKVEGIHGGARENLETNHWLQKKETMEYTLSIKDLQRSLEEERRRATELEALVSQIKSDDLNGLDLAALEDLSALHVEALTKLCHAKAQMQDKMAKGRDCGTTTVILEQNDDDRAGHVCKVCFEAPTAAVLLPCRHFCLCKPCAVACTECPLCRSVIQDRIITYTS
eukprot:c22061_g2_i1 orf=468-4226(+)